MTDDSVSDGTMHTDRTAFNEDTLFKVYEAIQEWGIDKDRAEALITSIQNKGILFRERAPETTILPRGSDQENIRQVEFNNQVWLERHRHTAELGYDAEHDDKHGVIKLLNLAIAYIRDGKVVKAASLIDAAEDVYLRREHYNPMQRDVERFMEICDQEVRKYPSLPSEEVKLLRIRLMVEELMGSTTPGVDETSGFLLLKNKSDELVQSILNNDLVGIADGLGDLLYVVFGTAAAFGINIQEVFDEVHRSNMTKPVWDEELQRWYIAKDEFGKGLKGPNYSPADISPIIISQTLNNQPTLEERGYTVTEELTGVCGVTLVTVSVDEDSPLRDEPTEEAKRKTEERFRAKIESGEIAHAEAYHNLDGTPIYKGSSESNDAVDFGGWEDH